MSEETARFGFLAAIGLGTLSGAAALWLGLRDERLGAGLFLLLALVALSATWWLRRRYVQVRARRWANELRRSETALADLWDNAQASQPAADPSISQEREPR